MLSIQRIFLVLPFLLTLAAYFAVRRFRHVRRARWHLPVDLLFIAYAFFVVGLLYFPLGVRYVGDWTPDLHVNLVPVVNTVQSFRVSIQYGHLDWIVPLLLGNLLLFVPLAFYLVFRFPGKETRSLTTLLVVSIGAEILQFLLIFLTRSDSRVTDIDDLLLNALGGIGGWMLARRVRCRMERRRKRG
jgi:glycopeptide antibiotics resistance protein